MYKNLKRRKLQNKFSQVVLNHWNFPCKIMNSVKFTMGRKCSDHLISYISHIITMFIGQRFYNCLFFCAYIVHESVCWCVRVHIHVPCLVWKVKVDLGVSHYSALHSVSICVHVCGCTWRLEPDAESLTELLFTTCLEVRRVNLELTSQLA